jgi:hypothetical protein
MHNIILPKTNDYSILEKKLFDPIKVITDNLNKKENILVKRNNNYSLLKYDGIDLISNNPINVRVNRKVNIVCIGNFIRPDWAYEGEGEKKWQKERDNNPLTHKNPAKRVVKKLITNFYGTHRIDFSYDSEFDIHLVNSDNNDLYLNIANKYANGDSKKLFDSIDLIVGDETIIKELSKITKPEYFKKSILPFIESRPTDLEIPKWHTNSDIITKALNFFKKKSIKPNYSKFDMSVGWNWLTNVTENMNHGDFLYVGSKKDVYLMGITKLNNKVVSQGTYTTSTKPMLFFSNTFVGNMGVMDMKRRLWMGEPNEPYNCGEYRSSDPPGFNKKPYIFSAIGRHQCCKLSLFDGEPDIITGNLNDALEHFQTTDFKEFIDIVEKYALKIKDQTPNVKPNGNMFYY